MCQLPMPAESTRMRSASPIWTHAARNTPSAVGERQILPRQTNSTFRIIGLDVFSFLNPTLDDITEHTYNYVEGYPEDTQEHPTMSLFPTDKRTSRPLTEQ